MMKKYSLFYRSNPKDKEKQKSYDDFDNAINAKHQLENEGYEVRFVKNHSY